MLDVLFLSRFFVRFFFALKKTQSVGMIDIDAALKTKAVKWKQKHILIPNNAFFFQLEIKIELKFLLRVCVVCVAAFD